MHSRVLDEKGLKMSKSKGNVLDPIELVQEYGADALRMALVYGVAPASDIALSRKKIEAMRNFTNKIWNAARFIYLIAEKQNWTINLNKKTINKNDKKILSDLDQIILSVNNDLENYHFGQALEKIYQFFWHNFCDIYIETAKNRQAESLPTLITVLITSLKLLHPFAPFVTEEIYQTLKNKFTMEQLNKLFVQPALIISQWPTQKIGK
jgi:valyl-tRNA synthetase